MVTSTRCTVILKEMGVLWDGKVKWGKRWKFPFGESIAIVKSIYLQMCLQLLVYSVQLRMVPCSTFGALNPLSIPGLSDGGQEESMFSCEARGARRVYPGRRWECMFGFGVMEAAVKAAGNITWSVRFQFVLNRMT